MNSSLQCEHHMYNAETGSDDNSGGYYRGRQRGSGCHGLWRFTLIPTYFTGCLYFTKEHDL